MSNFYFYVFCLCLAWQAMFGRSRNKKLKDIFQISDVIFVHFGLSKPCMDEIMKSISPISMSGFGFWLPLGLFDLKKKLSYVNYYTSEWEKRACLFDQSIIVKNTFVFVPGNDLGNKPTCSQRDWCPETVQEWDTKVPYWDKPDARKDICDHRGRALNKYYGKCTHFRKVYDWYNYLKNQRNSFIGAVLGEFWFNPKCGVCDDMTI